MTLLSFLLRILFLHKIFQCSNSYLLILALLLDVLYESETSTDLTNLSHCQNVPRHIIRRNKGRLPYTNCSDDVSDEETVLTRSR